MEIESLTCLLVGGGILGYGWGGGGFGEFYAIVFENINFFPARFAYRAI